MASSSEVTPLNAFANDGSFFDQFRKKLASQTPSKPVIPANPNCQKQKTNFRPKSSCKPINLKASFKKQLKSNLTPKSTLESKPKDKSLGPQDPASPSSPQSDSSSQNKDCNTSRNLEDEKAMLKRLRDNPPNPSYEDSPVSADNGVRKRKRKSRWGEKEEVPQAMETQNVVTVINGVPVTVPSNGDTPHDITVKALQSLLKPNKSKYEYDSDEDVGNGTWEHKQRLEEIKSTMGNIQKVNANSEGKHHLGDFLPSDELQRFMMKATAVRSGQPAPAIEQKPDDVISSDNIGYKMLQKAGWKEGSGLGANSNGITAPIDRGMVKPGTLGLGAAKPDEPMPGDDEFDVYRKRMMLAYKYRPNPMNNPRRAYY